MLKNKRLTKILLHDIIWRGFRILYNKKNMDKTNIKDYRNSFQRDRDNILYSSFFERLAQTTQTFIASAENPYFRTRLSHTLIVNNIARAIGKEMGLDEDLIEAIAFGHDVGHPPFGHAGEEALNEILENKYCQKFKESKEIPIFEKLKPKFTTSSCNEMLAKEYLVTEKDTKIFLHGRQSYRFLNILDKANLTKQASFGIMRHSYLSCKLESDKQFTLSDEGLSVKDLTYETQIVRIADDIACAFCDLEDGILSGIISPHTEKYIFAHFGRTRKERYTRTVTEIVDENKEKIKGEKCYDVPIELNLKTEEQLKNVRNFIKEDMLRSKYVRNCDVRAKQYIKDLFDYYLKNQDTLPLSIKDITKERKESPERMICDYISHLTDIEALSLHEGIFSPRFKPPSRFPNGRSHGLQMTLFEIWDR